ncbi:MAG TPA: hypothetical protein VF432_15890 [Thermoanaerobaculia bacterium]
MQQLTWSAAALAAASIALSASAAPLHVPSAHPTIQAAITAAAHGDEIIVAPGTYNETADLQGKQITLRSSHGPAVTILDGANKGVSILTAKSGESAGDTIVRGFTFRNGEGTTSPACNTSAAKGGAIFVLNSGLSVIDSVFEDNGRLEGEGILGGAIFACESDLAVVTSRFERNAASFGGAIDYLGVPTRRLTIQHSLFRANEAAHGGAITAALYGNSALTIDNSQFDANKSAHGGALQASARHSTRVTIDRSTFTGNAARGGGGAVHVTLGERTALTMTASRFDANRAAHGAGVLLVARGEARATIAECDLANGVSATGAGMNLNASEAATIDVLRTDFRNHEAGFGGGLLAIAAGNIPETAGGKIRIDGARFFDNVAHECCDTGIAYDACFTDGRPPQGDGRYTGGGADLRTLAGGAITVTSSLFAGNAAMQGGGVHASSCAGGTIDVVNTTIVGSEGNGIHARFGLSRVPALTGFGEIRVANSIVRDNLEQIVVERFDPRGAASVRFSNVAGGFAGEGNIDADPRFADPAARDYRLSDGSFCIDAGDNSALGVTVALDVTGRARFVDDLGTRDTGRGDGPVVDLGAYEFQPGRRRVMRR